MAKYISKLINGEELYYLKDSEARENKADKSATVSTVSYDTTNKKITKTINGTKSDVVTTAKLKSDMAITKSDVGLSSVTNDAQVKRTEMGVANGVATLDSSAKVPSSQLPSYVDDVLEYDKKSSFPAEGETGKIYIDKTTNLTWRWSGSTYVEISPSLALGETSSTAYAGNKGKALADKLATIAEGAEVNVQSDWNATSGDAFIKNKPTIPAAQVNSDWNATSGVAQILNKPTIPTVNNGKFSIKGAGTEVASTTANASSASSVDIVAGSNVTVTPDATNKKITIAATNTTYGVVSSSANGLAPKVTDTSKFLKGDGTWATPTDTNNRKSFYGTCDTAAATAAKVITLSDTSGWELKAGTIVGIKFTNTNSASNVTLNVNSSGAKSIWYNNAEYTGNSNSICGYANRVTYYMYDGTHWVWLNMGTLDGNTDTKVAQTVTTTSADYEVLFSATADNTTRTEGARKNSNLKFNPSTGNLQATQLNGVTIGSSPKFTDTTYSSKSAESEGTDVSLVTTGEKYIWNNKTSNTGTVTSVAVKMNGATKGTVTTSGTIDLGTVLTSHQDISGKADKSATVSSVAYNTTSKKITKTINGTTSDVVTAAKIVTDGGGITSHLDISGKVDKTTTVNGHALSGNVTVTKSDVGLGNVTNDSQVKRSEMGEASGVATLDSNGKVPSSQLPSYVDDVIEGYFYNSKFYKESAHTTEITGETGKIYVDLSANKTYRWGGSAYAVISETLALGETSSTAYRGDRGKIAYTHSQTTSGNPHNVTKSDVGLGNVGNFKAVSTVASQGLTDTEKSNARANIGAGTSSFSGSYNDLSNKPTIPAAAANGTYTVKTLVGSTTTNVSDFTANQSSADDVTFVQGSNVTITPDATNRKITIAAKDTTYSSKAAASGGTDVSLVTTGEKYTWNSKTSNTGTVTKVSAGTGLTGGDITTTGTIALATSGVTAGTYKRVTVDAYGRVTSGDNTDSDTKNTAGTTNKTGTKMFLAAATEQSANPVTYSNSNCYIGTDNCLYSGGAKVLTSHQSLSNYYTKTQVDALTRHTRLTDFDLNVLKQAVADQNLEKYGLKVGDQKTINGHTYVIAGLNCMKGSHSYTATANHVGLIVIPHTTHAWNASGNTYTGADDRGAGYLNSDLHYYLKNTVLPLAQTDLGASNLITHNKLLTNAVNTTGYNRFGSATGCSSSWTWSNEYISALSEMQVYGGTVWSSSGYDTGEADQQLEVFKHYKHSDIFGSEYPWLRDVAAATDAAFASSNGYADFNPAPFARYVAGLILFH